MGRFILWAIELDAMEAVHTMSSLVRLMGRCRGYAGISAKHPVVYVLFDTRDYRDKAYAYLVNSYSHCKTVSLIGQE